ncbi:MAG: lasso peptide biosynthesis B2 protein [Flavobacteriales bacterium]
MSFFGKVNEYLIQSDWAFRKLIVKTFFFSMYVRFLMLFVKFKRYEKRLGTRGVADNYTMNDHEFQLAHNIAKALNGVSNYTLWESKCMVQAVSAKWMLKKRGIPSTIYFGVKKEGQELKAHAWLKVGEIVVIGRAGHKEFKIVNYYS